MSAVSTFPVSANTALAECIDILRGVAEYELDSDIATTMREMGERKEFLTTSEHDALLALVRLTQERTNDRLAAQLALRRLRKEHPELFTEP